MNTITLPSQSTPDTTHTVVMRRGEGVRCDCKAHRFRGSCRHVVAATRLWALSREDTGAIKAVVEVKGQGLYRWLDILSDQPIAGENGQLARWHRAVITAPVILDQRRRDEKAVKGEISERLCGGDTTDELVDEGYPAGMVAEVSGELKAVRAMEQHLRTWS